MARLFVYGDYLDLVVPGQLSFDYYLGTTNGHWRTSDEQYQWGGRDLRYNGAQPISGTITFADYEYNGVKQWILDNASVTVAETVAYYREDDPGVQAVQLGWWNHAMAALNTEPNSTIYGGSSDDQLAWFSSQNDISLNGQGGTDTLSLSRSQDVYTFSGFDGNRNVVQVDAPHADESLFVSNVEIFSFGDGTTRSYSQLLQDYVNAQSVSSESTDSNVSTNDNLSTNDVVAFLINQANEIFSGSSTVTKLQITGSRGDYSISRNSDGDSWTMSASNIGNDTLQNFKRLEFSDGTLALDIDAGETAGQAYRLYQAAFARTPDMPGVAYHMNDMESNGLSILQIASNFMASPEFKNMYGENPTDDEYINALYQNVLGRGASDADTSIDEQLIGVQQV